ncbi:ketopantoate reductase family protein [Desulfocurvus sp. DL9XJH121]
MLITIVGCGALGCLLGARLMDAGHRIQALGRKGPHLDALRGTGIRLTPDWTGTERTFPLAAASHEPSDLEPADLLMVLVKTYQNRTLGPLRQALRPDGVCLTLQNGLGNAEALAPIFGEDNLAAGVAAINATRLGPGVVNGSSPSTLIFAGPWTGARDMDWVGEILASAFNATWMRDPRPAIWRKLCINAMLNPTAALTGMTTDALADSPDARPLLHALFNEAAQAAVNAGVAIDGLEDTFEETMARARTQAGNRVSMLQDVMSGSRTEIETISGAVLRHAVSDGDFPHTRTVYSLIKTIDAKNGFTDDG